MVPVVGNDVATHAARSVIWGMLFSFVVIGWMVVFFLAQLAKADPIAAGSVIALLVLGVPLAWLSIQNSSIAARLATDYFAGQLGFRPRWWMCYSTPRGWNKAIERQKRWHTLGRWPIIPW